MLELAQTILDLTGSHSRLVKQPLPADDPRRRLPDITLAQKELGWQPQVPLREGLAKTISYFDSLLRVTTKPDAASLTQDWIRVPTEVLSPVRAFPIRDVPRVGGPSPLGESSPRRNSAPEDSPTDPM